MGPLYIVIVSKEVPGSVRILAHFGNYDNAGAAIQGALKAHKGSTLVLALEIPGAYGFQVRTVVGEEEGLDT